MRKSLKNNSFILSFLFVVAGKLSGQQYYSPDASQFPGPAIGKINIMVLSDGYQSNALATFQADVLDFYRELVITSPFKEYLNYFNVFGSFVPSVNSGPGHPINGADCEPGTPPQTTNHSTAFGSSLDNFGIHRGLTSDLNLVQSYLSNPAFANFLVFPLVFVNTTEFGGTANIPAGITTVGARYSVNITPGTFNAYYDERVAIHELGHSFAQLQDEYYFPCPYPPAECSNFNFAPNRSENNNMSDPNHPWHHWASVVSTPPIGNFSHFTIPQCPEPIEYWANGGGSTGSINYGNITYVNELASLFKPTTEYVCYMEKITRPFCAVCREAIIERIHTLVSPVNSYTPNNTATLTASSSLTFDLNLTLPNPNTIRVKWELVNSVGQTQSLETDYNGAGDANGVSGAGGGVPSGVYRWHFDCEKFSEEGFMNPGIYKVRAKVFDMTAIEEGANDRWVRHPQHEIGNDDASNGNHEEIIEWEVEYNGISGTDLYVSDLSNDNGAEPTTSSDILWLSPEIWVCNSINLDCDVPGEPIEYSGSGSEAQVNFNVRNRGCKVYNPTEDGVGNVYWAKAGTGLEWPDSWNGNTFGGGPLQGDFIEAVPLNALIDRTNLDGVSFSANWALEDPSSYSDITNYNDEVEHFCLLVALNTVSDPYQMLDNISWPLFYNVKESNNVAWKNLSILDVSSGSNLGETTSTDVVRGGEVIIGNNSNQARPIKLKFEVASTEVGNPITAEAELRVTLHDSLWAKWVSGGQLGDQIQVHDASKRQIRVLGSGATLSGISLDTNEHFGLYLSVNYLTSQRSAKEFFTLHLSHVLNDSTQKIIGGETYLFRADANRNLFEANAGSDIEVLVGETFENKGSTIGESAIFNWYNQQGNRIYTGITRTDSASATGSEQLTLEVISTTDGYKDYDQVTVSRILGKITSLVPNPINSGTLAIGYKVSNTVSNPKIRLINISTQSFTEHNVTTGTGTLNVNVAGYSSGAYSVVLLGNSQSIDDELLIIQ